MILMKLRLRVQANETVVPHGNLLKQSNTKFILQSDYISVIKKQIDPIQYDEMCPILDIIV